MRLKDTYKLNGVDIEEDGLNPETQGKPGQYTENLGKTKPNQTKSRESEGEARGRNRSWNSTLVS